MTKGSVLENMLASMSQASDLNTSWALLCAALKGFEIDRVFYARKPLADLQSFQNRFRLTWFSTYEPEADRLFVEMGGYVENHTIRWALDNAGAMSWSENRKRYLSGAMSAQEEAIHLGMRELGLLAGITYATPLRMGQVRSGFGLCFREGLEQQDADRIWAEQSLQVIPCLQVFELAVSQMQNIPTGHELTDRQVEILRLTVDGKTTDEISALLSVHRRTVEAHLKAARERLGVVTTLQAAVIATQQGQL